MADGEDQDSKTLEPTQRKLDEARKKGEVAVAPEMRHAVLLAASVGGLLWLGPSAAEGLAQLSSGIWERAGEIRFDDRGAAGFASGLLLAIAQLLAPLMLLLFLAGIATGFAQGRPAMSLTRLQPKWQKVSPVAGLKRLFGAQGLVEFLKTLAKCAAVLLLAWWLLEPALPSADAMIGMSPEAIAGKAAKLSLSLLKWLLLLIGAIAAADLFYQRMAFRRKMRMSHQELKDEFKQTDGDPLVRLRQRQLGRQRSRQRMIAAVPTASVVITNPTHYAVALRYEHGAMRAPIVVAKGTDRLALRMRELATEAGVPLVENKPLARALYASAEVDRPIPVEQYAAVAEVISFVLRQSGKLRG